MRVGALTNKGAHYRFDVVRKGQGAVRGLTSISSAASGDNCRVRRGEVVRLRCRVRDFSRGRALRETATGRSAQQIVGAAHENVPSAHVARKKLRS
ncbi:MAG: hypothetical protein C0483_08340 [Pirellula sp.]|nr:hypothetical protein [Pirellula sp.]